MISLTKSLQEYLSIRRALGFKLQEYDTVIKSFLAFLHQEKAKTITTKLALRWAVLPENVQPAHWARRLSMVRGFAEYRSATDPMTEVPSKTALPHMYHRAQPYIYSSREIIQLVAAAKNLPSVMGLRPLTYSTLFGLLAVTGMRMSESIHLDQKDIDLDDGVLLIRQSKFRKSRIIPIRSSTQRQLQRYACERDRLCPIQTSQSFFI